MAQIRIRTIRGGQGVLERNCLPFETKVSFAATVKRLERVERPVLGGAEFLGEPDAGVLSLCVIDFREQVFVAVRGRSASDHGRCGQQQPEQLQQTAERGHFREICFRRDRTGTR